MKQLIEITHTQPKLLRIQYTLSDICNYKCWYCFPGSNTGTTRWPDVDVVKVNLVKLINYYLESKIIDKVQLNLLGGEPTLWPELGELVEYVSNNTTCTISMQTNASRTPRWWKKYGHYFDHVGISIHHERVDTNHISEVASILLDQNVSVLAVVLMDHKAWDKCLTLVKELTTSKKRFMILVKPIHIDGVVSYTDDQKKYLNISVKRLPSLKTIWKNRSLYKTIIRYKAIFDDGTKIKVDSENYFILNRLNNFNGWECNLGVNFIAISKRGEITGTCMQKLYGKSGYFNINDATFVENFNPTIKSVICDRVKCHCAGETSLPKRKIK